MKLTPQESAIRLVYDDAKNSGKPFKNPNNIIYRGPRLPWYKSRMKHVKTGQIAPFTGIGFSQREAKLDLYRQAKKAGWNKRLPGYSFEFAPMDSVLPKRLAKKLPEYGTPWHSARRWRFQDRINRKRRLRSRRFKR